MLDPLEVQKPRKQIAQLGKICHMSENRIRNGINQSAINRCGTSALCEPKKE